MFQGLRCSVFVEFYYVKDPRKKHKMSGFLETDSGTTNRLQNIIHLHTNVEHLQLGPWSYGSCAFSVPCFLYCFNKSWHQTSKQNIILNCQVIQNQRPFRWKVSINFALGKRLNLSLHQYHVIHTCIHTYIHIYICVRSPVSSPVSYEATSQQHCIRSALQHRQP